MKEYICIVCPKSCTVKVEDSGKEPGGLKFDGYGCNRGVEYARAEHDNPRRLLSTTVMITGSSMRRLPVCSDAEIKKPMLPRCFGYLHKITVQAPVKGGDVIVPDIMNSGVNIIAACDCDA
jgi:CxxC motif-containing protein